MATKVKKGWPVDDRPVVGVVAMDPAYSGNTGLVVRAKDLKAGEVHTGRLFPFCLPVRSTRLFRELGDAVVAVCPPGSRLDFVVEENAYRGVARKLGIAIGIVEGLLVDCGAVAPESRIDVTTKQWRRVLGREVAARIERIKTQAGRRAAWKAAAVRWALDKFGLELEADAAEALVISQWWVDR